MRENKKALLIADDEKELRDVLSLLLAGDGYFVMTSEDGQAAVEMMSRDIDLCILDSFPALWRLRRSEKSTIPRSYF